MKRLTLSQAVCLEDHIGLVPEERIADLPESQAGAWRHRCAACSYQMGLEDGLKTANRIKKEDIPRMIKMVEAYHSH